MLSHPPSLGMSWYTCLDMVIDNIVVVRGVRVYEVEVEVEVVEEAHVLPVV